MVAKAAANFCLERRIIPGQKPPVCDPTKRFSKVQFNCNNLILDEKTVVATYLWHILETKV